LNTIIADVEIFHNQESEEELEDNDDFDGEGRKLKYGIPDMHQQSRGGQSL
jgi:hypothetical protein